MCVCISHITSFKCKPKKKTYIPFIFLEFVPSKSTLTQCLTSKVRYREDDENSGGLSAAK